MLTKLKRIAALLPQPVQQNLKKMYFPLKIRLGRFRSEEIEYTKLGHWAKPGDWVVDIGANVGTYTLKLSSLVGPEGRVISFEPIPDTFELLATNSKYARYENITLIQAAASDRTGLAGMDAPVASDTGLTDYYRASIQPDTSSNRILTLKLDALGLPDKISLVKMDAEGHERSVLEGMTDLIRRNHPTFIVEADTPGVDDFFEEQGYRARRFKESWNVIYTPLS